MVAPRKLRWGVGINDADYRTRIVETVGYRDDGRQIQKQVWMCPFYCAWTNMLKRAYSDKWIDSSPTYQNVTVCEEWHRFSTFKAWMETQDWEGKQLDKDLLVPGNNIYSPETCIFVSSAVNNFVLSKNAARGEWPIGVSYHKASGMFRAQISFGVGSTTHISSHNDADSAHLAWALAKREFLEELIDKECIDQPLANSLRSRYDDILSAAKSRVAT